MNHLNILQWNVQSFTTKKAELSNYLLSNNIHVAILQETWLKPGETQNIPSYSISRVDRNDGYGGIAILIHNTLSWKPISKLPVTPSSLHFMGVTILNFSQPIHIYNLYCTSSNIDPKIWGSIFSYDSGLSLLSGDFNAKHPSWSSDNRHVIRGTQIFNLYNSSQFTLLNDGANTTV